jgi:dTDP-glucose 4,6-dehydratase
LEAARKHWQKNVDDKLFLHISTDEVFGSLRADEAALTESTAFYRPSSPYSASKACSDHLVYAWNKTYGLPTIITHCTNNYGPWQYPEKLIPLMINNALSGRPLPIYGDGLQVRDWLHVSDHCEALVQILNRGEIAQRYYISANNEQTNISVVKKICSIVDELIRPKRSTHELITSVTDRLGHDRRYALDHSKMTQEFSWTPRQNFDQSLIELVQWYQHHHAWTKSVTLRVQQISSLIS